MPDDDNSAGGTGDRCVLGHRAAAAVALVDAGFQVVVQSDAPIRVYAQERHDFHEIMAAAMTDGDDPTVVAKVIVAAATDAKPTLRYTAGPRAGRIGPARVFDKQIGKINRLAS